MSVSVKSVHKFKRLRKADNSGSDRDAKSRKDYVASKETRNKHARGASNIFFPLSKFCS